MGAEKKKYVSMDKRSKREQKEYYSSMRCGWNGLNPATRTMPNGKAYRRNKAKQEEQRLSREFRGGSSAESFLYCMFKALRISSQISSALLPSVATVMSATDS